MDAATFWLVRLGIDQALFTLAQARAVQDQLSPDADLLDFAQKLIDDGIVEDVSLLERIAALAQTKSAKGPPAENPFDDATPSSSSPATSPEPSTSRATAAPAAPAPTPTGDIAGDFPFDRLDALSDADLTTALRDLLQRCATEGVSDLHLSAGARPFARRQRELTHLHPEPLSAAAALRLNLALLAPHQRDLFLEAKDLDYALALDDCNRYRVNLMFHKEGAAGAYRIVAPRLPRLDELGLRNLDTIRQLLSYHNGLLLVTGPVGSGKTTTLAALVAELNTTRKDHIITVEDPIEIVQTAAGCNITQREVGLHTRSFATALKGALREDPDIIIIGELRDLETIEMAISASETGHLVIGTMHTSNASTTLNRLLDVFPPSQQTQMRASVAECLRGILCQRLLPAEGGGLVLAAEILVANRAVAALVRDGKTSGLNNVIETGQREGMCLMEHSVAALRRERKISRETAAQNISNQKLLAEIG